MTTPNGGEIVYTSSNDSATTVSASGLITAIASGNSTINITIKNTTISKTVNIDVSS
ncbi:Ig-like domain-containing protein [Clostridium ljungdahlii]|uniref:Ig-like domain-containing protein n=1 Tax=Clostridium ljungdahlii TaxID=1538 RepID=UPI0009EDEFEA